MNIWLVQYLCPQRHAIAALPYNSDACEPAAAEAVVLDLIANVVKLNPWCGLCGSRALHFEHGRLPFTDWDQAVAALRACEVENLVTRRAIDARRSETN